MSATLILTPAAAVEVVAHDEQLQIWAHEMLTALGMGEYLREDLDYSCLVDCEACIAREIKDILLAAFDHPEARTIKRKG